MQVMRMQIMLSTAKLALLLYWLGLLVFVQTPLAEPFAMLLGGVSMLLLLLHGATLLFHNAQTSQHLWRERLQLLMFGAFHLHDLARTPFDGQCLPVETSESRSGGSQTD
jgi:uncharacterized protein YhhL (DUF1145 family)